MEHMHGSKFKLVYTDWYIQSGERKPFGNGIHPAIRQFIQYVHRNNLNIDYYRMLQYEQEQKGIPFDHSELLNYFARNFENNIINITQIEDDEYTYIYPLEIKATLSYLTAENKFFLNDVNYVWKLKDIIPTEMIEYFKSGKVKILVNIIHDPLYDDYNIREFELEMNKLGINGSNIIVLGGSEFTEYYQKHPHSKVKIYNGHLFIKGYADMMKKFPEKGDLGYICDLARIEDLSENAIRPYKFLCNNKTMSKPHRVAMAYFSIKYDLLSEGLFSFIQKLSKDELLRNVTSLIDNPNKEYIDTIESMIPYELDTQHLEERQKAHFGAKNNMKEWYTDTYINLVTETFFGRNVFLSEKIFKPLSNLQPFIVLGDYGTLAELKRLGFKTFEPFIDESYDLEIERKKRIKKIEIEIQKLKNKSIEEIHNWYYSIKEILIHNQNHLYTFDKYECFEEIFQKIKLDYEKEKLWNSQEKKLL